MVQSAAEPERWASRHGLIRALAQHCVVTGNSDISIVYRKETFPMELSFLGIAVLNWTARNAIILGNIVGFGAIAALDVWGLFSGARQLTKVFAIIHLLFAIAFIWVGRMSMSAKTS
jgi:hypothetical protein